MSKLTIELQSSKDQTAFNLRRWEEVLSDRTYRKIPDRIETDRHGRILMSPPPTPRHARFQIRIAIVLAKLMPHGETMGECAISTADGVRGADVVWASNERWREVGNRSLFVRAPEICVEIISPSNSEEEIREKAALYFDAGAIEVWTCGAFGQMNFFEPGLIDLGRSKLCPEFPTEV